MGIYQRNTVNYRKIYQDHYGTIPVDNDGRTYEIHHIDGNINNNDPSNLKAVSIQEHYDIHYSQGDWQACLLISTRLDIDPKILSEIARKNTKQRVDNGSHPWLGGDLQRRRVEEGTHPWQDKEWHRKIEREKIANGTHPFLGGELSRRVTAQRLEKGTHNFLNNNYGKEFWTNTDPQVLAKLKKQRSEKTQQRVADGTHHFLGSGEASRERNRQLLEAGQHHSQKEHTCPHCGKIGRGSVMFRHHFAHCKSAGK